MGQQCTIKPFLGSSGNNTRSYGAARTYRCYVDPTNDLVVNAAGQQVVASARTHIYPVATDGTVLAAVSVDDQVTLPDGRTPRLLTAETQYDQFGRIILHSIAS
jgi:hypothetical protein